MHLPDPTAIGSNTLAFGPSGGTIGVDVDDNEACLKVGGAVVLGASSIFVAALVAVDDEVAFVVGDNVVKGAVATLIGASAFKRAELAAYDGAAFCCRWDHER